MRSYTFGYQKIVVTYENETCIIIAEDEGEAFDCMSAKLDYEAMKAHEDVDFLDERIGDTMVLEKVE